MNDFVYYTPTKVIFGKDKENEVGIELKKAGATKVLVHYGTGSVIRSGLLDKVRTSLNEAGIPFAELGGVVPNPRLSLVYQGIELGRREKIDFILAVGGGSVLDSAKAIGYGIPYSGDVWDFYDRKKQAEAIVPVGDILTLAATGSEMSNSSVITKDEGGIKRGYSNNLGRPVFSILDPQLTTTLPPFQTSCGCTDIIMHTLERYFTAKGNMDITDEMARGVVKTVMKHAPILLADPENYQSRAEVMWAGSLSHNGLTGCGNGGDDFATHRLEHELSGMYDVAHGAGLAALWGSWARYVMDDCLWRFRKFAVEIMDIPEEGSDRQIALKGIEAMEDFFRSINMPVSMSQLGVHPSDEDIQILARKCSDAVGGHIGAAKVLYPEDFVKIYQMAK